MKKLKFVMVGQCPRCGTEYVRVPIVDAAACTCGNPDSILVPLTPELILPSRVYAKFSKVATLAGVSVERLVNELLTEAAKQKLEELQPLPNITVATRR